MQSSTTVSRQSSGTGFEFDVFICYATDPDYFLARALQRFLTTFHQLPIIRERGLAPLRVCLDGGSFLTRGRDGVLSVEQTLEIYLQRSRQLLVLCSTGAVKSASVALEINWFLKNRGKQAIYLAVTQGKDPGADPASVFPSAALMQQLDQSIWYDLRGLRTWRARRWRRVRDAGREQVRMAAELLNSADAATTFTAEDLYPDWLDQERRLSRLRRLQWTVAASALIIATLVALAAMEVSAVRKQFASLQMRADASVKAAAQQPDRSLQESAEVWRDTKIGVQRAKRWPWLESEAAQTLVDSQQSVAAALAIRPGFAGTLTQPIDDAVLGVNRDGTRFALAGTTSGSHFIEIGMDDASGFRFTAHISRPERQQCLAIDSDGRRLIALGRRYAGLWSIDEHGATTPEAMIDLAVGKFSDLDCSSVTFAPNAEKAIVGTNAGELFEIDVPSGHLARVNFDSMGGIINDLHFDRAGHFLYVAVWRKSSGLMKFDLARNPVTAIPLTDDDVPRSLAIDSAGAVLFSGHERGVVTAHSISSNRLLWQERVTDASITSLCVVPGGVVVGDESGKMHFVSTTASPRLSPAVRMARTTIVGVAALPVRNLVLVAAAGERLRLWRSDGAHPLEQVIQADIPAGLGVTLSSDGRRMTAFGTNELISWIRNPDGWRNVYQGALELPEGWRIEAASPDGGLLALTAAYAKQHPDASIRLASRQTGLVTTLQSFEAKLWRGVFSRSGNTLAIASFDRPLKVAIWNTDKLKDPPLILTAAKGSAATAIAVSNDNSLLAVTDLDSCIYVWQLVGASQRMDHCDKAVMPSELAFDPLGSHLAVGSTDGIIEIFGYSAGELKVEQSLRGHSKPTSALAFDSSGGWLASASSDGELRFWETKTWQDVGVSYDRDHSFLRQLLAGPGDGHFVALSQGGRRVSIWDFDSDRAAARAASLSKPSMIVKGGAVTSRVE